MSEVVEGYGEFLADPISRCVIFQLSQPHVPGLFAIFDRHEDALEDRSIARLVALFQQRNPSLTQAKSQLLSEVAHNIYRSMFFMAFQTSNSDRRPAIFAELKDLLYAYLQPHVGDRPS